MSTLRVLRASFLHQSNTKKKHAAVYSRAACAIARNIVGDRAELVDETQHPEGRFVHIHSKVKFICDSCHKAALLRATCQFV